MKPIGIIVVLLTLTGCEQAAAVDRDLTGQCVLDAEGDRGELVLDLEEGQNYAFQSALDIQSVDVRAGGDLHFDWRELTVDMLGRPVDPDQIDRMEVLVFSLPPRELIQGMNDDSLSQSDLAAIAYLPTRHDSGADYLSLLSAGGVPLDEETLLAYLDPVEYSPLDTTFAVILGQGGALGKNARTIQLFRPTAGEDNPTVTITNASASLTFEADIAGAQPVTLPAGRTDIALDWGSALSRNAMGRPFAPYQITAAMVAHFADLTPRDLEAAFLEMETVASARFTADITAGTALHLGDLTDDTGAPFQGITPTGTWVVALFCGTCVNPAPWFLSVLEPC